MMSTYIERLWISLCVVVLLSFIAPAHADRAANEAFICHQVATNPNATPDLVAMSCHDKNDLIPSCELQAKKLGPESMIGPGSMDTWVFRYFVKPDAPCKDKKSVQTFCGFVQSYEGYEKLDVDSSELVDPSDPDYASLTPLFERSAKACATTPEAIRVSLCSKADVAKQWEFAYSKCPIEGRQIFMRECLKPWTSEEGSNIVRYRTEAECVAQYKSRSKKSLWNKSSDWCSECGSL